MCSQFVLALAVSGTCTEIGNFIDVKWNTQAACVHQQQQQQQQQTRAKVKLCPQTLIKCLLESARSRRYTRPLSYSTSGKFRNVFHISIEWRWMLVTKHMYNYVGASKQMRRFVGVMDHHLPFATVTGRFGVVSYLPLHMCGKLAWSFLLCHVRSICLAGVGLISVLASGNPLNICSARCMRNIVTNVVIA